MEEQQLKNSKAYVLAWNQPNEDAIKQALSDCVDQDVQYCDPFTNTIKGLDALAAAMMGVSKSFPGVQHGLVGEPMVHHQSGYYGWLARFPSGKEITGVDYLEFAHDGRIARVVSFTDPADWR